MTAYYNEFDPFSAQWLRNLIKAGHIAPGDVDERDLWDVAPDDIGRYAQVHLCAGIGIWSHALRSRAWPDDRPVWTASFPCQPFSEAGKGLGFADERHLWPAGFHLIRERQPDIVLGEQSASPAGRAWMELVQADLENAGYAVGSVTTPAAGFGTAPGRGYHIRHRQYWCARKRPADTLRPGRPQGRPESGRGQVAGTGSAKRLENSGVSPSERQREHGREVLRLQEASGPDGPSPVGGVGHPYGERRIGWAHDENGGRGLGVLGQTGSGTDLIPCTDGVWRPVESGTFPLVATDSGRVGKLRAYGNAVDAAQAQGFIEAVMECIP